MELVKLNEHQEKFEVAVKEAENFSLVQNAGSAFKAVIVVNNLREALTDEIMQQVFMPLMNTKIGFMTDRPVIDKNTGREKKPAYTLSEVRDAIIDAASYGLLPTFNQFNIIAGRMYPTKEGFTAKLKKIGVKYFINVGSDMSKPTDKIAQLQVKIDYSFKDEKSNFTFMATVPKDSWSSYDQLKGKAERRAKKVLYEYLTGLDLGDADTIDTSAEVMETNSVNTNEKKQIKI
jgi:hypothetical protein